MESPIEIARGLRRRTARHDEWNEDAGWVGDELLGAGTRDDLRAMLAPLLDLPVERILTFHGEPVLAGGREALAGVLA